jgi:hypothetical protein
VKLNRRSFFAALGLPFAARLAPPSAVDQLIPGANSLREAQARFVKEMIARQGTQFNTLRVAGWIDTLCVTGVVERRHDQTTPDDYIEGRALPRENSDGKIVYPPHSV